MQNTNDKSHLNRHSAHALHLLCIIVISALAVVSLPAIGWAESPAQIIDQIKQIRDESLKSKLQRAHFSKAPDYISIRIYKEDAQLEVWAGNNDTSPLKLLAVYPICAMGFSPGTKLKEGDKRTPEGSFALDFYNRSKQWFMHINLSPSHIDDEGNPDKDPAFYACTDYPTSFDKKLSSSIGIKNPGSAICLHGNCASLGCASMKNHDFIEIYYWMMQHNTDAYGAPRAHILPFRYYEPCGINSNHSESQCPSVNNVSLKFIAEQAAKASPELAKLGSDKILALWSHIRDREKRFIQNPTPQNAELEMSMDILNHGSKE